MKASEQRLVIALQIVISLALGAALSIFYGQDASWDLRNYHLYNAGSLMQGRQKLDFFPSDKQSSFNPLFDFIYAYLALKPLAFFPRVLAGIMGCWYGLFVFASLRIAYILTPFLPSFERRIYIFIATLVAITGAIGFSQAGTVSNDIAVASLILMGFSCVLRSFETKALPTHSLWAGGLLFGLAAGGKFTAVIYAPALMLSLILCLPRNILAASCVSFCGGWILSFALSFGWWGWRLWREFANPFFPFLNGIFKSPFGPLLNIMDLRFRPKDLAQWLAYPFFWAITPHAHPVYETDFSDPRMAIAYVTLFIFSGFLIYDFLCKHRSFSQRSIVLTRAQKIALVFLGISYVFWLTTSSILRYAIVLESLSVLTTFMAIILIAKRLSPLNARILSWTIAGILTLACEGLTHYSDWAHRPFDDKVFSVDMTWTPRDSLFLLLYDPASYLAIFTPPELHARFLGIPFLKMVHGTPLGARGDALIKNHIGPLFVVFSKGDPTHLGDLSLFSLKVDDHNCHEIHSNLAPTDEAPLIACAAMPIS